MTFNQKLDKASAEKAANYVLPGKNVTPTLSEDGKQVLLKTNTAMTANIEAKLKIKNIKTADASKTIEAADHVFTPVDVTIPSVEKVEALSATKIRVAFSEPVENKGGANLSGNSFQIDSYDAGKDSEGNNLAVYVQGTGAAGEGERVYELVLTAALPVGAHKLTINTDNTNQIVDYAGYIVPKQSFDFNIVADTTAPVVSKMEVLSRTEIQVTFNKPVDESTLNGNLFYWNMNGKPTTNTKVGDNVPGKDLKKVGELSYKIPFTTNPLPVGKAYLFNKATIKDLTGNAFATQLFEVTVPADEEAVVTSVVALTDTMLEVQFNKAMDPAAAGGITDHSKFKILTAEGKAPNATDFETGEAKKGQFKGAVTLTPSADKKKLTILLTQALPAGNYKLTVSDVKDMVGEKMKEQTVSFESVDKTPVAAGASLTGRTYSDSTNVFFLVTFPEAVATSGDYSVLESSKWKINQNAVRGNVIAPNAALVANAELSISEDGKTVIIKAPVASWTNNHFYSFGLSMFADSKGNIQPLMAHTPIGINSIQVLTAATAGMNIDTAGNGIVAGSLKVTSPKTVEMKLPKHLKAYDPDTFEVLEGGVAYDTQTATKMIVEVELTNNPDQTATLVFKMDKDLDLSKQIAIKIKAGATGNIDSDDLVLVANKATNTGGAVPGTDIAKVEIRPMIQGVAVASGSTLMVRLDQNMATAEPQDFKIELDGETKTPTAATLQTDKKYILLSFAPNTFNNESAPTLKTVKGNLIQSESEAGMKLGENEAGVLAKNLKVTGLELANGEAGPSGPTAAVNDQVVIRFAQAMDGESLGFKDTHKQTDGSYDSSADADHFVATIANGGGAGSTDTLTLVGNGKTLGVLGFLQNATGDAITVAAEKAAFKGELSADGMTLTLTLTNLDKDANSTDMTLTNANFDKATFKVGDEVMDKEGDFVNTEFTVSTGSKF